MGCRELQVNDYFRMTGSVSSTDVPYYALADANKNITDDIDASGTIQAHYEYSPFGKITQTSGTMTSDFDYRFSSEYADDETGLVYYNYRYYSAELGRWLNRDPIGEFSFLLEFIKHRSNDDKEKIVNNSWMSIYLFIGNNPLILVDTYGLLGSGSSPGTGVTTGRIVLTAGQVASGRIVAKNMCSNTRGGHSCGDTWSPGTITYIISGAFGLYWTTIDYIVICHITDKCELTATALSTTGDDDVLPVD